MPAECREPSTEAQMARYFDFTELFNNEKYSDATIKLGDAEIPVHKAILSKYKFFDLAFSGDFAESKTSILDLSDEETSLIYALLSWIYTATYVPRSYESKESDPMIHHYRFYIDMYLLAERLMIPALQNYSLKRFKYEMDNDGNSRTVSVNVDHASTKLLKAIKYLYENVPEHDRKFKHEVLAATHEMRLQWVRKKGQTELGADKWNATIDSNREILAQMPQFMLDQLDYESNAARRGPYYP